MKNIKFLLGLLTVVVIMASCAATQGMTDEDYANGSNSQIIGNRMYVQDPYYGTIVLERDPYTGRYYDVTYGSRYGLGYYGGYPYGGYYHSNRGGTYRGGNSRGGGYYRGGTVQQTPTPSQDNSKREEVRTKVLGHQ
jgi:hypothetical protein